MDSWLKAECLVNLIEKHCKQIQNISNIKTLIKAFCSVPGILSNGILGEILVLSTIRYGYEICFYFLVKLSSVVFLNIKIRAEQHYPVNIEFKISHASIFWSMIQLESADRILCYMYVWFWCNIQFSVQSE